MICPKVLVWWSNKELMLKNSLEVEFYQECIDTQNGNLNIDC